MLYLRILEKILNERDTKRSQYAQLVRVCESTIQDIRASLNEQQVPSKGPLSDGVPLSDKSINNNDIVEDKGGEKSVLLTSDDHSQSNVIQVDSEKYFTPLEMACKMKDSPKVTILALDSIQKLLAHGHLTGNFPNSANPNKRLIDTIVETICSCYNGAETDEGVELQIIKALLTIVTSQYVQIHEGTVLLTLRTSFNIYLLTKNPINQTTSRAMLTQMLQSTFTRMEHAYEGLSRESLSKIDGNMNITPDRLDQVTELLENWDQESVAWFKQLDLSSFFYPSINRTSSLSSCTQQGLRNEIADCTTLDSKQQMSNNDENRNLNGEKSQSNNNLESNCSAQHFSDSVPHTEKSQFDCPSILQKDAFLVFWAVCKLASKPSVTEVSDVEIRKLMEHKSIILSFQLVKSVLNNCGPVFRNSSMFCTAVKQHLCTALKEIGVSTSQDVYQHNLDLVIMLTDKFQTALGDETQKLLEDIIFPVLDENTSYANEYKRMALGAVHKIYNNFKSFVDLFLSQETEENGAFQRMINYSCKFTYSDKHISDSGSTPVLLTTRTLAVESILSLVQNMSRCLDTKSERHPPQIEEVLHKPVLNANQELDASTTSTSAEETFENPANSFVSALFAFLQNLPSSPDVLELDSSIQTISQRFYENGSFQDNLESSDAFYALIYSSISLIGERSSKQGKRRVSKEWFVKSNQSATANKWYQSLSDEFLELIYEEIDEYQKHQVKHRKHQAVTTDVQSQSFNNVTHNAKKIISILGLHQPAVVYEKQVRSVKKMFKIMGKPVLNALIGTLILYDDAPVTDLCLTALQYAIHISAVLNLKNDRDSFVQALSRLSSAALKEIKDKSTNSTLVVTSKTSSTTTMENGVTKTTITTTTETKCRNVDIILTLLNIAQNEGNNLQSSWLECLKCISSLEASELMRRGGSRNNGPSNSSRTPSPSQSMDGNNEVKSWYAWAGSFVPAFWDNSGKLDIESVRQSMDSNVNRVFFNSTKLDENGIVEFFKALCQVSLIEITHPENPRSFVYEKIFEVAHVNIHRPCLQWCSIWQVLSDFFSHLACSSDEDVSFFAIDSITKLVVDLLEKETFGNFRFQSHFLKPYEIIMQNTPFVSTREYVLGAVAKIIRMNALQLRSGWIPIFRILESSVFHDSSSTAEVSFSMLKNILHMFTGTEVNLRSSYQELLKCLTELSFKGPTANVQSESWQMLQNLALLVHTKPELFLASESSTIQNAQLWTEGWLPIFKELASVVIESEKYGFTDANQAKALTMLFELVKEHSESFHASWWQSLFGILFAIFHKLKFHGEDAILAEESHNKPSKGYNQFYCYYYIQFAIIDTFIRHFDILGDMLMDKLLKELEWCIRQGHDQIALSGVQCLHQLIRMLQYRMSTAEWTLIIKLLQDLLQSTQFQDKESTSKPVVQLELLKVVKTILIPPVDAESKEIQDEENENTQQSDSQPYQNPHADSSNNDLLRKSVGDDNIFLLLDAIDLRISHTITIQKSTQEESSTIGSADPLLVQLHETLLMDTYLRFLVQMYFHQEWSNDEIVKVESRFVTGITKVLQCFVSIQPIIPPEHLHDLEDVMTTCIQSLHQQLSPEKFAHFASILYPNLCDLLELDLEPALTSVLAKYFLAIIRLKIGDKNEMGV